MSTITLRLPDARKRRLEQMARARGMTAAGLLAEFSAIGVAQFDAETRFRTLAAQGSPSAGLAVLPKLDRAFASKHKAAA